MTVADEQYNKMIEDIIEHGYTDEGESVRTVWDSDGTPAHTKSLIGRHFHFDNNEVPILTSKRVAWKTAIRELLWIWQQKSNNVKDLQAAGVQIWNQWEQPDGTIGKAYGYQLGKEIRTSTKRVIEGLSDEGECTVVVYQDQVDYLLDQLKNNPSSRRHITTLWDADDLSEMALTPCVWSTQWFVKGGKLHLKVISRSGDMALGVPFNVFQYNVLQRMIAQVTGYEVGDYFFEIGDAHIYTRHFEGLKEQIKREPFDAPTLWINPEVKNFYDFTIDDFKLIDYKHGKKIAYEVAV